MISPDDPRISAYADGALPPEEAARFERELAADPAARAEIERLRALQRALREAFAEETAEDGVFAAAEADGEPEPVAPRVAQKRPYSVYRDADDARAEAAGWRPLVPADRPAARERWFGWLFPGWLAPVAGAACVVLLLAAIVLPPIGRVRETARRSVVSSNLRQVGQASLIFASDHGDKLPVATDVWDFARQLARDGGLNDAGIWEIPADPALDGGALVSTVLAADRLTLDPAFAKSRPAFAVCLGEVTANDPSTTPIAWTRGLQPDGTWAAHSPYGKTGGHIVFLGGNVAFYRNVRGQLERYDGKGKTSNILEALPPGARIGEYVPTAAEQVAWAKAYRPSPDDSFLVKARHSKEFMTGVAVVWALGGVAFVVYLSRRRAA